MSPWRLIAILEKCDPSFQELFYPAGLRCPLEKRIVRAIEEDWPVYFPTRKECRGGSWSLSIPESEPLYKPHPKTVEKLKQWKKGIEGTIAEGRAYGADISWSRFLLICRRSHTVRVYLRDLQPFADFLIREESMWPRYGGMAVDMDNYLKDQMAAMFASKSPYLHSDPHRLRSLKSQNHSVAMIQLAGQMRQLFDYPLMALAVLQRCAGESKKLEFWLDLQNHINAILKAPVRLSFRKTWFEHAMQVSGAVKKTGMSCPRKWARLLLAGKGMPPNEVDESAVTEKAIEVSRWLKGEKQPSVENIRRSWQAVVAAKQRTPRRSDSGSGGWIFSWMVTLLLEKHFEEINAAFADDPVKIRNYYRRFFHYQKVDLNKNPAGKGAGGHHTRQP